MKIAVGVSGGVDSTLSLALCRDKYDEVLAIHAFFRHPTDELRDNAEKLGKVCRELGAEYHVVDLSDQFEELVVTPFVRDYVEGRTPNPCAVCNVHLKFGLLQDAVFGLGADVMTTGHYARLAEHPQWGTVLTRGLDPIKDQSYFLSMVPLERLRNAVLRLGVWHKEDVYDELARRGIEAPLPGESQEICFIPDNDYCAFLEEREAQGLIKLPGKGPIQLPDGTPVGTHNGLWRYTLGQRRGIGVSYPQPLYVIGKDLDRNVLLVGTVECLDAHGCTARNVNLLVDPALWPDNVVAQTRYRQRAKPVSVTMDNDEMRIQFLEPQSLPTPGQIAAVYSTDGTLLAGGCIVE